jgi:hypothetical protein
MNAHVNALRYADLPEPMMAVFSHVRESRTVFHGCCIVFHPQQHARVQFLHNLINTFFGEGAVLGFELRVCEAGTLQLEPHLQFILLW